MLEKFKYNDNKKHKFNYSRFHLICKHTLKYTKNIKPILLDVKNKSFKVGWSKYQIKVEILPKAVGILRLKYTLMINNIEQYVNFLNYERYIDHLVLSNKLINEVKSIMI